VSSTLKQLIIGAMPASDPATFSAVNDNQAVSVCAKTNWGDLKDIQRIFFLTSKYFSQSFSIYLTTLVASFCSRRMKEIVHRQEKNVIF
jgi:hypothetical protein